MTRSTTRRTLITASASTIALGGFALARAAAHDGHDHESTPEAGMGHDGHDMGMMEATPGAGTPAAGTARHLMDGDPGVGGAYLTITNDGVDSDFLLTGSSPACQAIETHRMVMDGDLMMMEFLPGGIEVPAGGTVLLAPSHEGEYHLMLIGLTEDLRPDTTIPLTLTFQGAGDVSLTSSVRWTLAEDEDEGLADPVTAGDLTISRVWSRPAPALNDLATPAVTPIG